MGTLLNDDRFAQLLQAAPKTASRWSSIVDDLENTIQDLVASDALAHASIARAMGAQPAIPSGGYIQLGFVLYWAKHPPQALQQILDKLPKLVQDLWTLLSDFLETCITRAPKSDFRLAKSSNTWWAYGLRSGRARVTR